MLLSAVIAAQRCHQCPPGAQFFPAFIAGDGLAVLIKGDAAVHAIRDQLAVDAYLLVMDAVAIPESEIVESEDLGHSVQIFRF